MATQDFERKTKEMIDGLKAVCASYGLGNDGNEFKIITQVFLYKFLNDKFAYEVKKLDDQITSAENWEAAISAMNADDFEMLQLQLPAGTARLQTDHFIAHLFEIQNDADFAEPSSTRSSSSVLSISSPRSLTSTRQSLSTSSLTTIRTVVVNTRSTTRPMQSPRSWPKFLCRRISRVGCVM